MPDCSGQSEECTQSDLSDESQSDWSKKSDQCAKLNQHGLNNAITLR